MHRLVAALVFVLVLASLLPAGRAQFTAPLTKVTSGDPGRIPESYWNGSWGDCDDDGSLDLSVGARNPAARNYLYHNNHDGTLTLIDAA